MGEFLKHSHTFHFTYQGKLDGKVTKGEIIAKDKHQASAKLKQKNIVLTAPLIKTKAALADSGNTKYSKLFLKFLILFTGFFFVYYFLPANLWLLPLLVAPPIIYIRWKIQKKISNLTYRILTGRDLDQDLPKNFYIWFTIFLIISLIVVTTITLVFDINLD